MNRCVVSAGHVSYGWLAYVLFHAYHLDACEPKYLGKHTYQSSWCLRYGLMIWSSLLLFKCMGNLFENLENPLQSSSLICQSPTKAIWCFILKTFYTYAACLCIELCQIVVTLERNSFHAFKIKIHVHTTYPLAMLLWEVSIVPSIHSTQ